MNTETNNSLAADDIAVENAVEATEQAVEDQSTGALDAENQDTPEAKAEGDEADAKAEPKDGEPAEGDKPKKKNRVSAKDRIAQLTKERREKDARIKELEAQLSHEPEKPKREDFADEEDYHDARAIYRAKLTRTDELKTEAKTATEESEAAKAATWQAQQEEARGKYTDFDQVIMSVPQTIFNESVAGAILESDQAADVAYALASDLPRAQKLAAMSPIQQGREIGLIEAELISAAPKPKTISKAPPPVETLTGSSGSSAVDLNKMSMEDFAKHRAQGKF